MTEVMWATGLVSIIEQRRSLSLRTMNTGDKNLLFFSRQLVCVQKVRGRQCPKSHLRSGITAIATMRNPGAITAKL
jgi:hypothetical protein